MAGAGARRRAAVVVAAAALVAIALFFFDPAAGGRFLPPCPLLALTGLQCPGCGSSRAAHRLLNGELRAALALNPLLVVYLPVVGWLLADRLAVALGGRRLPGWRPAPAWIWGLLAVILVFWVGRNL